jgi:small subunit ribosomal protein S3Ae
MFDVMKGSGREGDASLHVIKVYLQIDKITDGTASTIFRGHEYAKEFLRSLVRRGSSMVTFTNDYTTMDGHTFRVASIAFTQRRVNSSKKHEIRMIAHKLLSERIPQLTVDQFVQELTGAKGEDIPRETNSKLGSDILESVKRITAVRHVGIKKTKLISTPESRAVQDAKPVESAQPAS